MIKIINYLYNMSHFLYKHKIPVIPKLIKILMRIVFGCVIPYQTKIGEGTSFGYYGLGIVLHPNAIIGKNCKISQQVTIGGSIGQKEVPRIGDSVVIGAGAKIIGNVIVGDNVIIGANSVVTRDIPNNAVAVGSPAKVIKYRNM